MTEDVAFVERALRGPAVDVVRRRLFRQLLESLVYEDAVIGRVDPSGDFVVEGVDRAGGSVAYRFPVRRRYGFARVAVGPGPVLRQSADGQAEAGSVTGFLGEVRAALDADPQCLARFAQELRETLVKDVLAQHARAERRDSYAGAGYDELETLVTDGHRYHPAYKSRIGFDVADDLAFGPEFGRPIRPLWLAARCTVAQVRTSDGLDAGEFIAGQIGRETVAAFAERLAGLGVDAGDYAFLPVHPWQWRERIALGFADMLHSGDLVVLGDDPHDFRAQQSIRTMACTGAPDRPYLKLALSIVNTSTSRGLAPHTVRNAPLVSDWLRRIVDGDAFLRDELRPILLGEVMGVSVDPEPAANIARSNTYGALGCIWRENVRPYLEAGEQAVPFNGLTSTELDGTPLVDSWVRLLGLRDWVEKVVAVSVLPLLHLLCGHGVALGSHAQNMLLVHTGGIPTRIALRDFHNQVRFARPLLTDPQLCPNLEGPPVDHANFTPFLEADDAGLVADFLFDCFFFVNLGELAGFLDDWYNFTEQQFWAVVRDAILGYQARFPGLAERFGVFDVFKPTIEVEKLTTRRLQPDTELRLHTVPNPLSTS